MVCISGFSACIWAGFSACICLAVVGAIEDVLPQTHQDFGYNHATTRDGNARGGAKQSHCCYCRRGDHILGQKLKASTPARLLYHPKYVWPLQTDVKAASHHPGFMCLPWRGNFLPCSPSWHTNCCTSVANPCALHWLNSGDGMANWSWLLHSRHFPRIMQTVCHLFFSLTKSSLKTHFLLYFGIK